MIRRGNSRSTFVGLPHQEIELQRAIMMRREDRHHDIQFIHADDVDAEAIYSDGRHQCRGESEQPSHRSPKTQRRRVWR